MIYDTDIIKLYVITRSPVGAETEAAAVEYNCVIENYKSSVFGPDGTEQQTDFRVLIDHTFPGNIGDKIELYKQFGSLTGDNKKYEIKKIFTTGGMGISHKQVYA